MVVVAVVAVVYVNNVNGNVITIVVVSVRFTFVGEFFYSQFVSVNFRIPLWMNL